MAKNHLKSGDLIDVVLAAAILSGAGILIGVRVGVAQTSGAAGDTVACAVRGVYELPKLSTDVVAQGALLYWDNTNKRLTVTATANTLAGYAFAAAGAGAATVQISLNA